MKEETCLSMDKFNDHVNTNLAEEKGLQFLSMSFLQILILLLDVIDDIVGLCDLDTSAL